MSGIFFGSLFWGLLILLIGLSMVMKHAFNIDFHLVRIFIGIIIILFGIKLITGGSWKNHVKKTGIFTHDVADGEYNIVFGDQTLDFSKDYTGAKIPREVNVVFGSATILVPDSVNLKVQTTTVFGSTELPDKSTMGFGGGSYTGGDSNKPNRRMETNVVFGSLVVKEVAVPKPVNDSLNAEPAKDSNDF